MTRARCREATDRIISKSTHTTGGSVVSFRGEHRQPLRFHWCCEGCHRDNTLDARCDTNFNQPDAAHTMHALDCCAAVAAYSPVSCRCVLLPLTARQSAAAVVACASCCCCCCYRLTPTRSIDAPLWSFAGSDISKQFILFHFSNSP